MRRWLLHRTAQALITLAIALALVFLLMRLAPGDPLSRLSEDRPLTPTQIEDLRKRYGLDRPVGAQFAAFLRGLVRGDLGTSIQYGQPVTTLIADRLPATLLLGGAVLLLNFGLGVWLGVRQAVRRGSAMDRTLTVLSLAGYAMPSFWLGLVVAWLVGVKWHLLPAAGMEDPLLDPGRVHWSVWRMWTASGAPGLDPVGREYRRDHAVPANRHAGGRSTFLIY